MRRALIATAGTAAALAALLSYKSSNAVTVSHVKVNLGAPSVVDPSASTTSPTGASSATSAPAATTTGPSDGPSTSTTVAPTSTTKASAVKVITGSDIQYNYGDIQLRVTLQGSKILKIDLAHESAPDPRSQSINSQAIPILTQEALAAQGLNFDIVSGATFTSEAFGQALQSILDPSGS